MLKSEIIDAVQELMQDPSGAARGNIGRWVNLVLDDLASRGFLESLRQEEHTTMEAGDDEDWQTGREYTLASDTDRVIKVFVPAWGTSGILTKKSNDEFLTHMHIDGFTTQGQPTIYTVFGRRTLRIHPIPSSTYAPDDPTDLEKLWVWKYKDIEHLTENDEITEISAKHIPLLVKGAYAYGAKFDSLNDSIAARDEYERAIAFYLFDSFVDLDQPRRTQYRDW